MALEQGQHVGDYEVLSLLGSGGMGQVYRVRNIISDRQEAMKVLLPDYASEPELAARFVIEIRTVAALEHPNIAQLRTAFQFQNQLVMMMEFVEGVTLEKLTGSERIPVENALDYAAQVLSALSYAHNRGVTHRDIKPANIMITSHGLAKLMDFGIAKSTENLQLTRPGTTMGSIYYMSPEQVLGGAVDARSDLYSLGVTMYEMLTGRRPFHADTSFSVLNAHLRETPVPPIEINPTLPSGLNQIVLCAMAKKPADRFQSADEMRSAIRSLQQPPQPVVPAAVVAPAEVSRPVAAEQSGAAPVPPPVPPPTAPKSHRGLWIAMGSLVTVAALAALAALLPRFLPIHAGQQAQKPAAEMQPVLQASPAASTAQTPATAPVPVPQARPNPEITNPDILPQPSQPAQRPPEAVKSPHATPASMNQNRVPAPVVQPPPVTATQSAAPAGPSPQQLREAHDRLIDLSARAEADKTGVESIRRQQQAQGLDLRGDILAAMNRLDNDMNEASQALNRNDPASANQYLDRAEQQLSMLDSFLGR
jgi:eukaryotic-like serine/threonine-protein kinase